jgi:hypothetical protein
LTAEVETLRAEKEAAVRKDKGDLLQLLGMIGLLLMFVGFFGFIFGQEHGTLRFHQTTEDFLHLTDQLMVGKLIFS